MIYLILNRSTGFDSCDSTDFNKLSGLLIYMRSCPRWYLGENRSSIRNLIIVTGMQHHEWEASVAVKWGGGLVGNGDAIQIHYVAISIYCFILEIFDVFSKLRGISIMIVLWRGWGGGGAGGIYYVLKASHTFPIQVLQRGIIVSFVMKIPFWK